VIPSWLLDLAASALAKIRRWRPIPDSWKIPAKAAGPSTPQSTRAVPAEVLTAALFARFRSPQTTHLRRKDSLRDARRFRRPQGAAAASRPRAAKRARDHQAKGRPFVTEKSAKQRKPDPCSFVVFGVTGDLTHRLVIPALYNLAAADLLPDKFCVVGVARKGMSSEELRDSLLKGLHRFRHPPSGRSDLRSVSSNASPASRPIRKSRPRSMRCASALRNWKPTARPAATACFYLATPPTAFAPIVRELGRTGMLKEDGQRMAAAGDRKAVRHRPSLPPRG